MSGEKLFDFIALGIMLSLTISGCVSEPSGEGTPAATSPPPPAIGINVEVLNAPVSAEAGKSFEITWRVNSPEQKNISHTAIHYGPEPKSEPLSIQSYPDLTVPQAGLIPADFSAGLVINRTGILYFRAHAIVDNENFWSDEMMLNVSAPRNITPPAIMVTAFPSSVTGDTDFIIQWEVSGGTPGEINNTAIYWGFKSGGEDIADYPRVSAVKAGRTPQTFVSELKAPSTGTIYLRAYAVVDGSRIYSEEHTISIISQVGGY